jgi:hypothetical protein
MIFENNYNWFYNLFQREILYENITYINRSLNVMKLQLQLLFYKSNFNLKETNPCKNSKNFELLLMYQKCYQ